MVTKSSFRGLKTPELETGHSSLLSAEAENALFPHFPIPLQRCGALPLHVISLSQIRCYSHHPSAWLMAV